MNMGRRQVEEKSIRASKGTYTHTNTQQEYFK